MINYKQGINRLATAIIDQAIKDVKRFIYLEYKNKHKLERLQLDLEGLPTYTIKEIQSVDDIKKIAYSVYHFKNEKTKLLKEEVDKLLLDEENKELYESTKRLSIQTLSYLRNLLRDRIANCEKRIDYCKGQYEELFDYDDDNFELLYGFSPKEAKRMFDILIEEEKLKYARE